MSVVTGKTNSGWVLEAKKTTPPKTKKEGRGWELGQYLGGGALSLLAPHQVTRGVSSR
jgi:hypothetical protein